MTATQTTYAVYDRTKQRQALVTDYMKNSFYLPRELLRNSDWQVEPIKLLTGDQFVQLNQAAKNSPNDEVQLCYEGATYNMLEASTQVGVSERKELATGKIYLICKAWQGAAK